MTVFDLLGRVPDDSRVLELAEPLAALDAELPVIAPGEYRGGHPGLVGEPQEVAMRSQAQQPDAHRHQQRQPHDGAIEYRPEATRQAAQLDLLEKPETEPGTQEQAHRRHAPRPGDVGGAAVADAAAHGKQSQTTRGDGPVAEQRGVVLRLREWWVAPAVAVGLLAVWMHSLTAREPGEGE